MIHARGPGRRQRFAVAVLLGSALALAPIALPLAAVADGVHCPTPAPSSSNAADGIGIAAVVCGPTGSSGGQPGDGSATAPGGFGSVSGIRGGNSNGGGGTSSVPPSSVAPSPQSPTVTADEVDVAGILAVGGLSTGSLPSVDPFGGEVQVWFTVRNTSRSTIDLTADFWMENVFGLRIAAEDGMAVDDLKPGETRTISADLPGAGQWTVLTTHARINPPAQVDGADLASLTRDATVFVLPWLLVLLIALGGAAAIAVPVFRRELAVAEPTGVPA